MAWRPSSTARCRRESGRPPGQPTAARAERPGSSDLEMPLAQVVVRYTAPASAEFNDMQLVMFSHVDVAGIGGEEAVARGGAPVAIGLPRRWSGAFPRPRLAHQRRPSRPAENRAQLRGRSGGLAPAGGGRSPRLAGRARAGDRSPRGTRCPRDGGRSRLRRSASRLCARHDHHPAPPLRHGEDGCRGRSDGARRRALRSSRRR
jgi:hypothetical protein